MERQANGSSERRTRRRQRADKLIPAQRRTFILDVLQEQGAASVQQLSDRMGASFSTVRRDLDHLAERGIVQRSHGGAVLAARDDNRPANGAGQPARGVTSIKVAIGGAGADRISDGQSVVFDSNNTVLEAARAIAARRLHVTTVTNNLKIASVLAPCDTIRLIVLGGTLRTGTFALYGEPGESFLGRLHADVAVIGAQSAFDGLLTDSRVEGATMKRLMMAAARRKILLIDSWKFGGPGFCDVAALADFDEVITDDGIEAEELAKLRRLSVSLTIVAAQDGEPSEAACVPEPARITGA